MNEFHHEQNKFFNIVSNYEQAIRADERARIMERLKNLDIVTPWKPAVAGKPIKGGARAIVRTKGQKRSPEAITKTTNALFESIKANPGERIEEIAVRMGTSTGELVLSAKKLLKDKKIKTTGHRRATRYFPK